MDGCDVERQLERLARQSGCMERHAGAAATRGAAGDAYVHAPDGTRQLPVYVLHAAALTWRRAALERRLAAANTAASVTWVTCAERAAVDALRPNRMDI